MEESAWAIESYGQVNTANLVRMNWSSPKATLISCKFLAPHIIISTNISWGKAKCLLNLKVCILNRKAHRQHHRCHHRHHYPLLSMGYALSNLLEAYRYYPSFL